MLFFKVFFVWKCIKIIYFFYFLKFIFDINILKYFKNKKIFFKKFKFQQITISISMAITPD